MGLDTKTYWLTDRQSQCDFDFDSTWIQGERDQSEITEWFFIEICETDVVQ
jgi:hypothetical protein